MSTFVHARQTSRVRRTSQQLLDNDKKTRLRQTQYELVFVRILSVRFASGERRPDRCRRFRMEDRSARRERGARPAPTRVLRSKMSSGLQQHHNSSGSSSGAAAANSSSTTARPTIMLRQQQQAVPAHPAVRVSAPPFRKLQKSTKSPSQSPFRKKPISSGPRTLLKAPSRPSTLPAVLSIRKRSAPLPDHCVRLIDVFLHLRTDELKDVVQETTPFKHVISALGSNAVGKSTILSRLVRYLNSDVKVDIFHRGDDRYEMESVSRTTGVDVFMSPCQHILLDSQPINAITSIASRTIANLPLPRPYTTHQQLEGAQSLQLSVLFSVLSSVLLVVVEVDHNEADIFSLINTALLMRVQVLMDAKKDVLSPLPHIVFIVNKVPLPLLSVSFFDEMQLKLASVFSAFEFQSSQGFISNTSLHTAVKRPIHLFLLPDMSLETEFEMELEDLLQQISTRLLKVACKGISEISQLEWLESAGLLWSTIQSPTSVVSKYVSFMQKKQPFW